MPAGASDDFLFCAVEIDSLLLLLLYRKRYKSMAHLAYYGSLIGSHRLPIDSCRF